MAEWSIAAVLKTVDLNGSGGSNPSLSAKRKIEAVCLTTKVRQSLVNIREVHTTTIIKKRNSENL